MSDQQFQNDTRNRLNVLFEKAETIIRNQMLIDRKLDNILGKQQAEVYAQADTKRRLQQIEDYITFLVSKAR